MRIRYERPLSPAKFDLLLAGMRCVSNKLNDKNTVFLGEVPTQGVPSPFFPGILVATKPRKTTQNPGKQLVFDKNDGGKEWKRNQALELQTKPPTPEGSRPQNKYEIRCPKRGRMGMGLVCHASDFI